MFVIDQAEVEAVTSKPSQEGGSFREVWIFGEIVIKKDRGYGYRSSGCAKEYARSLELNDTTFQFDGETWALRFPATAMVGEYLIMEYIDFPDGTAEGCTECEPYDEYAGYDFPPEWHHSDSGCLREELTDAVARKCMEFAIYDMHERNFKFDLATRTVWIIDFAC